MTNIIFETIVRRASARIDKLVSEGVAFEQALDDTARDMELLEDEIEAVRQKKAPPIIKEPDFDTDTVSEPEPVELEEINCLYFSNDEEIAAAVSVLMMKKIPWVSKDGLVIKFGSFSELEGAKTALNRKWDFVNNAAATVAVIEFDSLELYEKVLEFIASKRMTVLKGENRELDDDIEVRLMQEAEMHQRAVKAARKEGLEYPAASDPRMSFAALHTDAKIAANALEPLIDPDHRCIRVVKSWK